MKRAQKVYADKISILADIHAAQRKIGKMMKEQEELDTKASSFFLAGDGENGKFHRSQAEKIRASIGRIEKGTLRRLKETLSSFQTVDMFGHQSTVLQ